MLITSTIDIDVLRFLRKMIYFCWDAAIDIDADIYYVNPNVCSMSIGVRSERSRISDAHDSA